jgi:hypothetical protein
MYGALLVNRQKRIDAAAQMSRIHFRLQDADQEKVRLQVKVARATTASALKERIGEKKLAEYRSVRFRFDPSKFTEQQKGNPLTAVDADGVRKAQEIGG